MSERSISRHLGGLQRNPAPFALGQLSSGDAAIAFWQAWRGGRQPPARFMPGPTSQCRPVFGAAMAASGRKVRLAMKYGSARIIVCETL